MKKVPNTPNDSRGLKNENNRVTQEGDEDALEDNTDKIDKEEYDNEQGNKIEEVKINLHGKPGNFSEKIIS